jgi:hypothetical protein
VSAPSGVSTLVSAATPQSPMMDCQTPQLAA